MGPPCVSYIGHGPSRPRPRCTTGTLPSDGSSSAMSRIPNLRICHTTEDEEIHLASAMPCADFYSRVV